jgi:hypothetical protein
VHPGNWNVGSRYDTRDWRNLPGFRGNFRLAAVCRSGVSDYNIIRLIHRSLSRLAMCFPTLLVYALKATVFVTFVVNLCSLAT